MAVWERQPSASLTMECQALLAEKGFTGHRLTLSANKLRHLDDALPDLIPYPHLKADIRLLAEMFSCLFGLRTIGLRLTPLTGSMCPRFHVDRVPCRLITTYVGTGTEWLPHDLVDRSKLGVGTKRLVFVAAGNSDTASRGCGTAQGRSLGGQRGCRSCPPLPHCRTRPAATAADTGFHRVRRIGNVHTRRQ